MTVQRIAWLTTILALKAIGQTAGLVAPVFVDRQNARFTSHDSDTAAADSLYRSLRSPEYVMDFLERPTEPIAGTRRIGVRRLVSTEMMQIGEWTTTPLGPLWSVRIRIHGARGVRIHFTAFHSGAGVVSVYNDAEGQPLRRYTGDGPNGSGDFWSHSLQGETLVVAYEPRNTSADTGIVPFKIIELVQHWDMPGSSSLVESATNPQGSAVTRVPGLRTSTSSSSALPQPGICELNATCSPEWAASEQATVMMGYFDSQFEALCTGTLMATRNGSGIPYFLTAKHCVPTPADALTNEFFWNYQTSCGGFPPPIPVFEQLGSPYSPTTVGAQYLVGSETSDFALLRLNELPSVALTYSGWDPSPLPTGTGAAVISHPQGSWKRIAFGTNIQNTAIDPANFYQLQMTNGRIEPGSSGGGLFSSPGVLVGTVRGPGPGIKATDNQCAIDPYTALFGKFSSDYALLRDYLEDVTAPLPAGERVYFGNRLGNTVTVIDALTNNIVTNISVPIHPKAISVSPDRSKVYVGNSTDASVLVISTALNQVIATITPRTDNLLGQPGSVAGLAINADGSRLYIQSDQTFQIIDTTTNNQIAQFSGRFGGSETSSLAVTPDGGLAFMSDEGQNIVRVMDLSSGRIIQTYGSSAPGGIAITPDGTRAYFAPIGGRKAAGNAGIQVIDIRAAKQIALIDLGSEAPTPFAIAMGVDGKVAAVTGVFGTGLIDLQSNKLVCARANVGGNYIALSEDGKRAYVSSTDGSLIILDMGGCYTSSPVPLVIVVARIPGAIPPSGPVAITPPNRPLLYVTTSSGVSLIDTGSNKVVGRVGDAKALSTQPPTQTVLSPDGQKLYVSTNPNYIAVLDRSTGKSYGFQTPGAVTSLDISPDGRWLYVGTPTQVFVTEPVSGLPFGALKVGNGIARGWTSRDGAFIWVTSSDKPTVGIFDARVQSPSPAFPLISVYDPGSAVQSPDTINSIIFSPDGSVAYALSASNRFIAINTTTRTMLASIALPAGTSSMAISPDGLRVWVTMSGRNQIIEIDTKTETVLTTSVISGAPGKLVISHDSRSAYIVVGGGNVAIFDCSSHRTIATIPVGANAIDVTLSASPFAPGSGAVLLPNQLVATPNPVVLTLPAGFTGTATQDITITAGGAGLPFSAAFSSAVPWAKFTAVSGKTPGTVVISIDAAALLPGTNSATVAINAAGAVNSPLSIPIRVETGTAQTITFAPLVDVTAGTPPFTVSATSTSGLPVTFTASPAAVCTVSGNTVTVVGGGTCSITASESGSASLTSGTVSASRWAYPLSRGQLARGPGLRPAAFGPAIPVTRTFTVKAAAGGPAITPAGIVPVYSSSTTIQSGSWISIYGTNLAPAVATWNGDFPTSLGGVSVSINGRKAYLWYVSPGQLNLQAPDDNATGTVAVTVVNAKGSWTSNVTLGTASPAFSLLDGKHVAGIILRSNGSGAYGGGIYDILGPSGSSLGYKTTAARAGDSVVLFGVGFGPTTPPGLAGQVFSGAAATVAKVQLTIGTTAVTPSFAGLSSAGLYQINLTVPAGLGAGDAALLAGTSGLQTQSGVVIALQ